MRKVVIEKNYLLHPAGSVLISVGNTKVICSASIEERVPSFCIEKEQGWLTAEYSMLPGSTSTRNRREVSKGKVSGRTAEIQRLIGRSLRSVVDLKKLNGFTLTVDCDVIQADGGTRTASITGACVAIQLAFDKLLAEKLIIENPLTERVAAISVGIVGGEKILDLDYIHDSQADVDMNVVMTESGKLIEVQGTAEEAPFSRGDLNELLDLAETGINKLFAITKY
jgi:ribonuclease PH